MVSGHVVGDVNVPTHPGLRRARRAATLLDGAVEVRGVRVGIDPLLSVVPVAGDGLGLLLGGYVVAEAWRAGVPRATLAVMCAHLVADAVVGSIPVVGPLLDAAVRANERNVELFERALASQRETSPPATAEAPR